VGWPRKLERGFELGLLLRRTDLDDSKRMRDSVAFKAKVALEALRGELTAMQFRDSITEMRLPYVLGIQSSISLWPAKNRYPQSNGVGAVGRHPRFAAMPKTSPSRPNKSRWTFPRRCGGGLPGGKAATASSPRASPPSVSVPRMAIITEQHRALPD
jgi:hypothetical protein